MVSDMLLKCSTVRASQMTREKATAALKSHLKYLHYRQHNSGRVRKNRRHFFSKNAQHVHRPWIEQDIMHEQAGSIYYHYLLLSPAHDEPIHDWRQWTCAIMHDLEKRFGQELNWYAVIHNKIEMPHVHVILQGMSKNQKNGRTLPVTFNAHDFAYLRERGRAYSEYEQQRSLAEQLRAIDQYDTISNDILSEAL